MSIAQYPWDTTAQIRAHYAKRREECHARYEAESTGINREEQRELDDFRKLMEIVNAQGMAPEGRGREGGPGSSELPSPVAESDAPKGGSS